MPQGKIITPKTKEGAFCVLTNGVLKRHIERAYAVGVFAGAWGSKFICFDVDDGDRQTVLKIMSVLSDLGIPNDRIYVSYSGGKGYHVELFFDAIVSTERLYALYSYVINTGKLNCRKVEFRPTHTAAIKLPLSLHAKTGNTCWYVDRSTFEPLKDVSYILEIQQLSAGCLETLIPSVCTNMVLDKPAQRNPSHASPQTQNLGMTLTAEGTRHNMMRNIAVYQRCQGKTRDECEQALKEWMAEQDRRFFHSDDEAVRHDLYKLVDWVYSDRFVVPKTKSRNKAEIAASEVEWLLEREGRSVRRILFLLLVRSKMKCTSMSLKDISKATGVSQTVVKRSVKRLLEDGSIESTKGQHMVMSDGSFVSTSNHYTVKCSEHGSIGATISVTMSELIFSFENCYWKSIHALIPSFVLEKQLTR